MPMLVLNHLPESSNKSSTLSLTNSLDWFRPLFIQQWVILSASLWLKPVQAVIQVFHDLESNFNLHQNDTKMGLPLNAPFMLITMVQIPPSHLIPSPRYLAKYIQRVQHYFWPRFQSVKCTHCVSVPTFGRYRVANYIEVVASLLAPA